jgi:hypothetical protein
LCHRIEAEVFERVASELAVDLSARSRPAPSRLPRSVHGNGDDLTVGAGASPVVGKLPDVGADI